MTHRGRSSQSESHRAACRILVVDTDVAFQQAMSTAAADFGHHTIALTNGCDAREVATQLRPDIVLLDAALSEGPGHDGRDTLQKLKTSAETAEIPVLMYSSRPLAVEMRHILELGAEDFVLSPVDPIALVCKIERIVLRTSSGRFPVAATARDDSK